MRKIRKKGFTLLELIITIAVISLILLGIYSLGVYSYRQYVNIHKQTVMKRDIFTLQNMLQSDIARGGRPSINFDNHGITIVINREIKKYFFKDNAIYLTDGKIERKFGNFVINDALWIIDNNMISMSIVFQYKNSATGEEQYYKVIKDIEVKE